MIVAPDESYSTAEAGKILERSERQVLRYLTRGLLRGSKASGHWKVTALQIWEFRGIADAMMDSWRAHCRPAEGEKESE